LRCFAGSVSQEYRDLLFDPQTSGGLLIAITAESADAAISALIATVFPSATLASPRQKQIRSSLPLEYPVQSTSDKLEPWTRSHMALPAL